MNNIYKVVKSNSTGILVAVSELTKGARKGRSGNKLKLASLLFLGVLSHHTYAATSIPQGFKPANNSNHTGSITLTGAGQEVDLGLNNGLNSAEKGDEVLYHSISTEAAINALYQTKYTDVATATANYNQIKNDFEKGLTTQADVDNAYSTLQTAQSKADAISDDKFSVNDPNNLIGSNTEGTVISEKNVKYTDPVTGKIFQIKTVDKLTKTEASTNIKGGDVIFYEKNNNQYSNLQMLQITGADTDVTINNSLPGTNDQLNAISKNNTGVISVENGADLTVNTNMSYYIGGAQSTSTAFEVKESYDKGSSTTLNKVIFKGKVSTILGERTIASEDDFNKFNKELIKYIQTNQQVRLDYPSIEEMQAFYNTQISNLYTVNSLGHYDVTYTLTNDELKQLAKDQGLETEFNNKVTTNDVNDIGLASTSGNYFIGVKDSGSVVTLNSGNTISNSAIDINGVANTSSGTIIKADFDNSGINGNNIFNIDGKIDANSPIGKAIVAKNAEIYVADTGYINGSVTVKGTGDNGSSTGNVINNAGTIMGNIIAEYAVITNKNGAIIEGNIIAQNKSTVQNDDGGTIKGIVSISDDAANFVNNGVAGGVHATNGASVTNNNTFIGNGIVELNSESTLTNEGDIYIGYNYDQTTDNRVVAAANTLKYNGLQISGKNTQLVNNKNIYASATQHDVNAVAVSNGGTYVDKENSVIILNKEKNSVTGVDKDKGNNNIAVYVTDADSSATIKGNITLNDSGSSALWIQNGGSVTLNGGNIDINSLNVDNQQIRSFGAWVQGDGSTLIMDGNAHINMNADRAIGVHIRDGATAEINEHAGITFSDKENQIGFLISGISKTSSIQYNSDQLLKLKGEGSVLFRVERGSVFNTNTIESNNPSLSILDSNNTKNSTLIIITNGGTAAGKNNKTIADLSGFTLKVNGENAKGISVEGGAQVTITKDTKIELTGDNSILAKVDGKYYDLNGINDSTYNGNSYLESSANLTTNITGSDQIVTGQNSVGYYVTNAGTLDHKGSIDFDIPSKNNIGVKINSGGTLISEAGSYIRVHGTAVEISGSSSIATVNNIDNGEAPVVWAIGAEANNSDSAYHVLDQARLNLTGTGITKAQGTAHGILVDGASQIILNGSVIDLYGDGSASSSSTGNGIENRSSLTNIQLTNHAQIDVLNGYGIHSSVGFSQSAKTSGVINVYGDGTGIRFEGINLDGSISGTTNNSINNTSYENVVINVYKDTGHGIYVDSNKNVNTSASVNIISDIGNSALEIKGTTAIASQSGKLHSANTNSVIVDLNNGSMTSFTNSGELLFGTFVQNNNDSYDFAALSKDTAASSYAIQTNTDENALNFTNAAGGVINGTVELLGYGNSANSTDKTNGNTVTLIGEGNIFKTGDGNDTFIVKQVIGDDLGGVNQVKQFTQLDGGYGEDSVTFDNKSNFTINKDETITNIEYFALNNASKVTLNDLSTIDGLNTNVTTYDVIDTNSLLTYKWAHSNTSFDRYLKGKGTFKVDLTALNSNGKAVNNFAFNNSTNIGDFKGILELTNVNYKLADNNVNNNTIALTNATLKVSDNSYVEVGKGDQVINGLYFNGGTVNFGTANLSDEKSPNHISVDNLVLESGKVQIDVTESLTHLGLDISMPLLEQDDGVVYTQLIAANKVSGGAINIDLDLDRSKIKLIDEKGNEIKDPEKKNLIQNNEIVARATYNTRLTTGEKSDGLYIGYGLTKVELKTKNDANGNGNALIFDATNSDPSKASSSGFDALITDYDNEDGTYNYGDLQIRGNKAVTLSGSNSYHGSTFVKDTSSLISGVNNALGNTRLLQLDSNTRFDLNGKSQTLGSLYTNSNSTVDLNSGTLAISGIDGTDATATPLSSYVAANTLKGSGKLIIGSSSVAKKLLRTPYSITMTIDGDNPDLTADVVNSTNGIINMNSYGGLGSGELTNNGTLNLNVSTDGSLTNNILNGSGILNKYDSGTLSFSLSQAKDYSGEVNVNGGTVIFNGDDKITTNSYATSKVNVSSDATLIGLNNVTINGDITNSGKFYVGDMPNSISVNHSTVTVNNYTGNSGSHLVFNGTLSDDDSPISKLIINGNSTGTSQVSVNNIGGLGASTINGISIIDVNGQSDAEFIQADRIIAGAYEYKLQRSQVNSNNWVLSSNLTARPETGAYLGHISSANNIFDLRLHDRLSETQYTDFLTGEQKVTSMWLRHQYNYTQYKAANGDLSVKNNLNVTQIGSDIAQWSTNGFNRLHLGVMAGYAHNSNQTYSNVDGAKADGSMTGYSYGAYATWYDNNEDKSGLYIDSWVQWNTFKASVKGNNFFEKYRLKGLTASIESGYSLLAGKWGQYDMWLQPKAQVIWEGVKGRDFTESNGTRIKFNHGNVQTRLGFRVSLMTNTATQAITNNSGQFFVEANWLHNTKLYGVTYNNETTISQDGARNIGEIKVGIESNIQKNTNFWFNLASQRGDHNYKNVSVMLGAKYSF